MLKRIEYGRWLQPRRWTLRPGDCTTSELINAARQNLFACSTESAETQPCSPCETSLIVLAQRQYRGCRRLQPPGIQHVRHLTETSNSQRTSSAAAADGRHPIGPQASGLNPQDSSETTAAAADDAHDATAPGEPLHLTPAGVHKRVQSLSH